MPIRKTRSGQPVLQYFTAEAFNAFVDAANRAKEQGTGAAPLRPSPYDACLFQVRNDTGSALARFDVVGLDEPIVLPVDNLQEFQNLIAFSARVPTSDDTDRYAVVQEPLAAGAVGLAAIAGVTVVKTYAADATEAAYRFAGAVDGVTGRLGMLASGGSPILYRASGTSSQWSIVRIDASSGGYMKKGYLDGDLTYGGSVTVSIWAGDPEVDTGDNVTAKCWLLPTGDTLESGLKVDLVESSDGWEIVGAECPSSGS